MGILSIKDLELNDFLSHDCLFKMIDFAIIYAESSRVIQETYFKENCSIRSRLNVLSVKFKHGSGVTITGKNL